MEASNLFSYGLPAGALVLSALLVALQGFAPTKGLLRRAGSTYKRLASRKTASCILLGVFTALLRLVLLPIWPKPLPRVYDEFSYLLMGQTFALGRMTNPSPPHWQHFETLFVQLWPTYQSSYPVAQGMILAIGQVVFGHPWWGVLLSSAILSGSLCWMAQAWLPPSWALLAAFLSSLQFTVTSYWTNSYWGGAPAAIGGAILLGCWPRLARHPSRGMASLMAFALLLLANSRPWEGLLLALVVVPMLAFDMRGLPGKAQWRVAYAAAAVLFCGAVVMGWYFWRVTGSPFRMPYQVAFEQYAAGGIFFWQAPHDVVYNHAELRQFYQGMAGYGRSLYTDLGGFLRSSWAKVYAIAQFYVGPIVLALLAALPLLIRNRRSVRLMVCIAAVGLGNLATTFLQIHYAAPIASAIVVLSFSSLRVFWLTQRRGWNIGLFLVPALCFLIVCSFAAGLPYAMAQPELSPRQRIAQELKSSQENQLIFVRYGPNHAAVEDEWIYNDGDLPSAKLIWARDQGDAQNRLVELDYPGRRTWLIEPDLNPLKLIEYR